MERDLERFVERLEELWKIFHQGVAMITRILRQDGCDPDAAEHFEKEFTRCTGMSMREFQDRSMHYHSDEMDSWCYGDLRLSIEASDPSWKLERIR